MKINNRKVTVEGILRLLNDVGDEMFPMDRKSLYKNIYGFNERKGWEDYFPSEVQRTINRLERKGWVEKKETEKGLQVTITDKGRRQVLLYILSDLKPKSGKWDGKWRVVFFDVGEKQRNKRDKLRSLLLQMGFWEFQESVYVSPFDYTQEVKYIREALDIPHGVKLGVITEIENEEDLKERFGV